MELGERAVLPSFTVVKLKRKSRCLQFFKIWNNIVWIIYLYFSPIFEKKNYQKPLVIQGLFYLFIYFFFFKQKFSIVFICNEIFSELILTKSFQNYIFLLTFWYFTWCWYLPFYLIFLYLMEEDVLWKNTLVLTRSSSLVNLCLISYYYFFFSFSFFFIPDTIFLASFYCIWYFSGWAIGKELTYKVVIKIIVGIH